MARSLCLAAPSEEPVASEYQPATKKVTAADRLRVAAARRFVQDPPEDAASPLTGFRGPTLGAVPAKRVGWDARGPVGALLWRVLALPARRYQPVAERLA